MSSRNALFYSFPLNWVPLHIRFNMKWSCHFYCIFTEIEAFFTGKILRYFNRHFITFISCILDQPICFTVAYRRSLSVDIYLFLIWEKFVVSSVCWFASQFAPASNTKSSSLCSAAIFQLFFRWRRNCSNLLMQAKRNNLWEKIFLGENKTLSNKL